MAPADRGRRRLPVVAALAVLAVLGAGCAGGSSDDDVDDADGGPSAGGCAAFGFDGLTPGEPNPGTSRTTVGCRGPRHYVDFAQLTVDEEVELRSLDTAGTGITAGRAWISDDEEQSTSSGLLALGVRGPAPSDQPGWAGREPLEGATLEPGTVYTYFVELTLDRQAEQPGLTLGYVVGGDDAELTIPDRLSRRPCR